jgi:hypothetical protein
MHAEHADIERLNDPSERMIGCPFTVLNTRGQEVLSISANRAEPSACICFHLRKIP